MLFYQALWIEAGPTGRLAVGGGVAVAALALAALAWAILRVGLRLPVGWFFGAGSLLMAGLAVVLAGKGIAALQRAGVLPVGPTRGGGSEMRDHPPPYPLPRGERVDEGKRPGYFGWGTMRR